MIKINIIKKDDVIDEITFSGHALYDDYGKDIVCASVSSILTTTVNAILHFDDKAIIYNQKKDNFKLQICTHSSVTDTLIDNMIELLQQLELNYKKNIKIDI